MKKGLFITFEGIDGCGKTTQARLLAKVLKKAGHEVLLTREPGGTSLGKRLRQLLLNPNSKVCAEAELFLYLADRAQHVREVIAPALKQGRIVISERFADSTVAYQGAGRNLSRKRVEPLNRIATAGLKPNLTFLLNIPLSTAQDRKANHPLPADRLERLEKSFHQRLAWEYRKLAAEEPRRIHLIKAAGSIEQVHQRVMKALFKAYPTLQKGDSPTPSQRSKKK
ncbi:MAG: dTMP kinase [Armatimonadetes bacterium]|nr:dTMP kinase [Armatimonadota bacterium]NIO74601.1 dTMP kinase [Armatimonadota bacterium]NIO96556.1 dTMP kinase [Armatimonadota bacterium]